MSDLQNYRTEFRPDFKFTDCSKEFLSELLRFYGRAYMALDGFWYIGLLNETDNDFTLKVDHFAWEKGSRFELKRLIPLAGIEGNGLDALFKFMQLVPWMQVTDYRLELESPHRGILSVSKCSTLDGMEKAGDGRERQVCSQVDAAVFRSYARHFNPDIKVEPLLLPPRADRQGICCRWEFTLE